MWNSLLYIFYVGLSVIGFLIILLGIGIHGYLIDEGMYERYEKPNYVLVGIMSSTIGLVFFILIECMGDVCCKPFRRKLIT